MSQQDITLTCFENIIGLSRTTCECYENNLYNESKSDLYLDELQGLELSSLKTLEGCEDSDNIWTIMDKARNNAILGVINDITGELTKKHRVKRQPYIGAIGRKKFTQDLTTTQTYLGCRWYCADIVSGNLKIKKIHTAFNSTGVVTLYIYNNCNELLHTLQLQTEANKVKENILLSEINLPAHNSFVDNVEYYFVYQYDANMKPKNIDIDCSSCSGFNYTFNTSKPYFYSQTNKKKGWANFIMVGGWSGDDLVSFDSSSTTAGGYMNGLLFEVEFGCKLQEVICNDSLDFDNNVMAITLAFLVRYKAGEYLLTDLIMSSKLNRETMINVETANGLIGFYQTKYKEYIDVIMKQIDIKATDCFECVDFIQMTKRGIFA